MKIGHFCLPTYFEEQDGPSGLYMRRLIDYLAESEDLGFDSLWANEHHFCAYGGLLPSPPIFLAGLAERTKKARLGTSIVVMALHNPVEIAEQLAMVDLMSDGRVELGVGRGFVPYDYEALGVPLDEGQERTLEGLEVVQKAWTGQPFSHHGRFYQFEDLEVWPRPQQERPPIWLGCVRTPESFEHAARAGYRLATVAQLNTFERMAELIAIYRRTWADCGRDPTACQVATHYEILVDDDGQKAREMAVAGVHRDRRLNAEARAKTRLYRQAAERHPPTPEEMIEQGRVIAGTPDEVRTALERAQDAFGLTEVHAKFLFGGLSLDEARRSMALFAERVLPGLRTREREPLGPTPLSVG